MDAADATVFVRHAGALHCEPDATTLLDVSVGPLGEAISLWTDDAGRSVLAGGGSAGLASSSSRGAVRRDVVTLVGTVQSPSSYSATRLQAAAGSFLLQPMSGGRLLLVNSVARWTPSGGEHNASVISPSGSVERSACIGDGIAQVRTDLADDVWVAYSDQGILGDHGWGVTGADRPIGERGVVRFDRNLEKVWEFPTSGPLIDDCDTVNLCGGELWVYPYSEFLVVRCAQQGIDSWRPRRSIGRVTAMIVGPNRLAMVVGNDRNGDRLIWGEPGPSGTISWVGTARLRLPGGGSIPAGARLLGCADELHLFVGRERFTLALDEVPPGS